MVEEGFSIREHCYQFVRKYGKTVDILIIYIQFMVISEDCLESNVQKASFIPKAESGDSAKSLLVLRHKIFVTCLACYSSRK